MKYVSLKNVLKNTQVELQATKCEVAKTQSNIDYIAMIEGIELEQEEETIDEQNVREG